MPGVRIRAWVPAGGVRAERGARVRGATGGTAVRAAVRGVAGALVLGCLALITPVGSAEVRTSASVARSHGGRGAAPVSLVAASWADLPLAADGVVPGPEGEPLAVRASEETGDGSALARQDAWLAAGLVPGGEVYRALAERALRDLDLLVGPDGAVLAAAEPGWDYVWPRDASFVAVALARTGHPADALAVLEHLARLHATSPDGVFEARYLPDGSGAVPDGRARQLDGCGWVGWAAGEWFAVTGDLDGAERLAPMLRGCLAAVDAEIGPDGLPGPWSDYWEVAERVPTLGTVAALLTGSRAVVPLARALGDDALAARAEALAVRLAEGVARFAPEYPRHLGGSARDTAVAFLMPPFAAPDQEVARAWADAQVGMRRPAGGLAPGEAWRADGVSWTPTTAVFALTAAASGERDTALAWLEWLAGHTTVRGSLPEKVLGTGEPASVAPLAWTAALVLLTLVELG